MVRRLTPLRTIAPAAALAVWLAGCSSIGVSDPNNQPITGSAQDAFARAKADLQVQILQFLRDTGTLRVDPNAGVVGHVLDRRVDLETPIQPPASEKLVPTPQPAR